MKKPLVLMTLALLLSAFCSVELCAQTSQNSGKPDGQKTEPPKLTEAQVEALKEQRAKALNENALIVQVQAAMQVKNYQEAASGLMQLIQMEPNRYEFYANLGAVQINLGKYEDALQTLDKGIQLARKVTAPKEDPARTKAALGQMLTNQGNAYIKLRRNTDAVAAFEKAAALDSNPGTAYFNLCATQYNMGNMDDAAAACNKSIAADPTKADAYFIKGSALYGNGKLDAQNKYIVPPGTIEALKKYLELAPEGGHAADVKAMLEALDVKIETTFGQKKK
jgi:tetratricopeptide (TPR) repeat protein